jgi:hypothetical protein
LQFYLNFLHRLLFRVSTINTENLNYYSHLEHNTTDRLTQFSQLNFRPNDNFSTAF